MKRTKHKKISHKHTSHRRQRRLPLSAGRLGAGTLYFVIAMLVITFAAASMIGNIIPLTTTSPAGGQAVIISPPITMAGQNNLQLFTFPGVTHTPTPPPTLDTQNNDNNSDGFQSGGGDENNRNDSGGDRTSLTGDGSSAPTQNSGTNRNRGGGDGGATNNNDGGNQAENVR